MKKDELVKEWQEETEKKIPGGLSLEKHATLLETLCGIITAELLAGGEISLPGLGKLKVKATNARTGRNPKTGEAIEITAGRKVVFAPGKEFKEAFRG